MKQFKKHLLGFDMRQCLERCRGLFWKHFDRETYLVNMTVDAPLSVDTMIWPSIFSYAPPIKGASPFDSLPRLQAYSADAPHNLWLSLATMRAFHAGIPRRERVDGVEVAIELIADPRVQAEFPLLDFHFTVDTISSTGELLTLIRNKSGGGEMVRDPVIEGFSGRVGGEA